MAKEQKKNRKYCVRCLTHFIHIYLGVNLNEKLFCHKYHTCEVWFPDLIRVEYDRILFKQFKIR